MAKNRSLYHQVARSVLALTVSFAFINEISIFDGDSIAKAANVENAHAKSEPQKREAWMDASDYSVSHPVVAFAVNGRTPDATNHQIAEFIKGRFAEKNVTSAYFTGREESIGVSFYFYIEGHQYGPVGMTKLMATIDEVAGHSRSLQTLQSN